MPDQQPAATENTPVSPNDADTPATAMTGSDADRGPGGGGLGPRTGAAPAGGMGGPLGTAPNAVLDTGLAPDAGDQDADAPAAMAQAQVEAAHATAREPQPSSS
jgi:hypothetical protein